MTLNCAVVCFAFTVQVVLKFLHGNLQTLELQQKQSSPGEVESRPNPPVVRAQNSEEYGGQQLNRNMIEQQMY